MRLSEKALVIFSRTHGPEVHVHRLREIEVRDASEEDIVEIEFVKHSLPTQPESIVIRGSKRRKTLFPNGTVRVKRIAGKAAITVLAFCEVR